MGAPEGFDAMAQACIENHAAVMKYGTPEMQTASRLLLYALAEELRRRSEDDSEAPGEGH
jgi:hypothetical protein